VQLNARCADLEGLAGPAHSAIVRELLEKERAVQSRVSQIANSQGQSLQKGATEQVPPSSMNLTWWRDLVSSKDRHNIVSNQQ
jgi:hypothetical protein